MASVLESLTERELRLVKDAAVMGYVRGKMSSRTEPIRKDSAILGEVIDACLAAPDLYPAINAAPPTEAQSPYHRWYVETRDGVADQWAPGERFTDRAEALERYQAVTADFPTWKDGTPVERRFVRETTTYTVEQPAVVARQDGMQEGSDK
ncbi:hypothetical protein ACFQ0G_53925 [Streptomyces chiangmaiensis]